MKVKLVLVSILVVVAVVAILPAVAGAKPATTGASIFDAKLSQTNARLVTGDVHIVFQARRGSIVITLRVTGLQAGKLHSAAITGFTSGRVAKLPNPGSDTNHDGLISFSEVSAVAGAPLVWLEPLKGAKHHGTTVFHATMSSSELTALSPVAGTLGRCAITVYGVTQQPTYGTSFYDPTAPAACGLIVGN